ncbi:TonB-dependent receptor domain-containing protein [Sphingomonas crusticola]|uniref:TonB-dependent receptor domain-containing protein n=1 Tax=Sphingomonas crusticola TaxID=1697973 RepID=UPI000E23FF33|nr:TonB-dependent receptor [Sphingomonas crusticola]
MIDRARIRLEVSLTALALASMLGTAAAAQSVGGTQTAPVANPGLGAQPAIGAVPGDAADAPNNSQEIIVTGSRISIGGYTAPTPVTAISEADLQRDANLNIADSINALPSVGISATPSNGISAGNVTQGDAALSTINLRNLGIARTLILFDGQRVVSSNILSGGVDLTTIPSQLVKRVDVVTGGASAAYGSDAVSGVVNLILDRKFTGLKADVAYGNSTTVSYPQTKVAVTAGHDFASGRGHVIVSGEYSRSPKAVFIRDADWYDNTQIVQNPAATATNGLPFYIHVPNAGTAQFTQGGLIRGNTAGGAGSSLTANSLAGMQFVGNGSIVPFNFGTVNKANPNICYAGCSGNAQNYVPSLVMLGVPYHTTTLFGYASYDLTSNVTASLQLNYGRFSGRTTGQPRTSTLTIAADNAFLPASVAAQFGTLSNGYNAATGRGGTAAVPTQSITLGTVNTNNIDDTSPLNLKDVCNTVGEPCLSLTRRLIRGVATLEGKLGDTWSWTVYGQHSEVRERQIAAQDNYGPYYNFAVDAVKVTAENRGASNLPIGSIQCRALLVGNPSAAGCVPLNIFGNGVASQDAITYVNPGQNPNSGILNRELVLLKQDVVSASMQGELPWGLPAGKIAVAFGGEYRREKASQGDIDPVNATNPWPAGNFKAYSGRYDVKEGFLEVNAPILENTIVKRLDFNAAGRITDYSTSGLVKTWKLGLTTQIDDNIRLRGTRSLDIRAPLISDLFSPGNIGIGTAQYPTGGDSYQVKTSAGGNPALKPEKAVTKSVGVVFTPQFIKRLWMSLDWYSINIHGGIYSTGFQTIINRCLLGETVYCQFLVFSPTEFGGTKPSLINQIPANAASLKTSGLDFQANYRMRVFDGSLSWALLGNYTHELTQTAIGVTYDSAGALGGPLAYASSGVPKLRGTLSATYAKGPWSGTIQGRFIGAANLTNGVENLPANIVRASLSPTGVLTQGVGNGDLIDDNRVNAVGYLDLRLSYQLNKKLQLYGAIDNVTNVHRPQDGSSAVYDVLGSQWRVGVRMALQ